MEQKTGHFDGMMNWFFSAFDDCRDSLALVQKNYGQAQLDLWKESMQLCNSEFTKMNLCGLESPWKDLLLNIKWGSKKMDGSWMNILDFQEKIYFAFVQNMKQQGARNDRLKSFIKLAEEGGNDILEAQLKYFEKFGSFMFKENFVGDDCKKKGKKAT